MSKICDILLNNVCTTLEKNDVESFLKDERLKRFGDQNILACNY